MLLEAALVRYCSIDRVLPEEMPDFEGLRLNGLLEIEELMQSATLEVSKLVELVQSGEAGDLVGRVSHQLALTIPVGLVEQNVEIEWLSISQIILSLAPLYHLLLPAFGHVLLLLECTFEVLLHVERQLRVDGFLALAKLLFLLLFQLLFGTLRHYLSRGYLLLLIFDTVRYTH